jgi:hypothetical protein
MLSTKTVIELSDIPDKWVYENYLSIGEPMDGREIKIKSPFKSEKTPSMFIYIGENNRYKFKCFSSSFQGDCIELVEKLFTLSTRGLAASKIVKDYQDYLKYNKKVIKPEVKVYEKYKLCEHEVRHWSSFDALYWKQFHIGSTSLNKFNVQPLSYYKLSRLEENGTLSVIEFKGNHLYGYFDKNGEIYKIYQPKNLEKKFLLVKDYLQGKDQLTFTKKYLLIVSSLKDLMSFYEMGINNIECIAPNSENVMISEKSISYLKSRYKKIIVLFDNDDAGNKSAALYKHRYGLSSIKLRMEKDVSDSVKLFGIDKPKIEIFKELKIILK